MEALKRGVRQFLTDSLHRKVEGVGDHDSLLEAGVIDSLAVFEIVEHIEQQYSVTVSNDDLIPENFDTIEAIAAFIAGRRDGARG